jgi:hypothetical protein
MVTVTKELGQGRGPGSGLNSVPTNPMYKPVFSQLQWVLSDDIQ